MDCTSQPALPPSLFRSFWVAGYESSCHINRSGRRIDMIAVTQHGVQVCEDYKLLQDFGIASARDAVRWPLVDSGGRYDFASFTPMLRAAQEHRIQVIWDLCHYGWPDDLDVLSTAFVDRFARFSRAVARVIADTSGAVPFYTPVNEISFLSYAIGAGLIYPFISGRDVEIKRQFVRASIAAVDAVRSVDPRARIVFGEPTVHVVAPANRPELRAAAAMYREAQFESWDMLSGRLHSDLGGGPNYLDIVGVNYYHSNQWDQDGGRMRWEDTPRDPRMLPFRALLDEVYDRYHRPLFVAETSHFGVGRAPWIRELAAETQAARCAGIPVEGICLYPIIDRPDWEDYNHWHNSGLWDLHRNSNGSLTRVLNPEYAAELRCIQKTVPSNTGC